MDSVRRQSLRDREEVVVMAEYDHLYALAELRKSAHRSRRAVVIEGLQDVVAEER